MREYLQLAKETYQDQFFESVRTAMVRGISADDVLMIAAIFGAIISSSLLLMGLVKYRFAIRREIVFYGKLILGKAEWADRRHSAKYPISILIPLSNRPLERHHTVNLSRGGMFIKTPLPFEVNTHFEFILKLNESTEIKGAALVRWVKKVSSIEQPTGMGCEFIKLSDKDLRKIRLYLRRGKER